MGKRNSATALAKLTKAEAKVALAARHACSAAARATHAARVAKATSAAATLAARVHVPTKALPYVAPVDVSSAREVVRLARAASLCAVLAMRAIRMADARLTVVKARATKAPAIVVPALVAEVHTVVEEGFSAWHRGFIAAVHAYVPSVVVTRTCATASMSMHDKVLYKALRLGARRGATKAPVVYSLNSADVRLAITDRDTARAVCNKATAKVVEHMVQTQGISLATAQVRAAQSTEQKEWNATRKANALRKAAHKEIKKLERSIMGITPVVQVRAPRKALVAKLEGAHAIDKAHKAKVGTVVTKQASYPEAHGFRTSPLHPVMGPTTEANAAKREAAEKAAALVAARKAAKRLSREEWLLQKAHRQALKEQYIALRAAKVNRICTEIWYKQGVWVDTFLVRACNDSDHHTRVAAMTELLALRGGVK